jgi:hypothetical protein
LSSLQAKRKISGTHFRNNMPCLFEQKHPR